MSKKKLSVIITVRGEEPFLQKTIQNVRDSAHVPIEIVVVYDGTEHDTTINADQILRLKTPRGCGGARHHGIVNAEGSVVFLTDAHMSFQPGFGKIILNHFEKKENESDVTCGRCCPANADLSPDLVHQYTAGRFSLKSEEPGGERWVLSGKWAKQNPGEVGCVYGASYAFRKKWYNKIGQPLNLLRAWWGDEEYISISSWLAGGRCVLLDYWASHFFREKPGFDRVKGDALGVSINRFRLLDLLPIPAKLREDLSAWMELNIAPLDSDFQEAFAEDRRRKEVQDSLALWKSWASRWDDFAKRFVDDAPNRFDDAKRVEIRENLTPWKNQSIEETKLNHAEHVPHVQERSALICPNCGSHNSFKVETTRDGKFEKRQYGKCREPHCRLSGVKIIADGKEIMRWGREVFLSAQQ